MLPFAKKASFNKNLTVYQRYVGAYIDSTDTKTYITSGTRALCFLREQAVSLSLSPYRILMRVVVCWRNVSRFFFCQIPTVQCFTHDEGQHSLLDRLFKVTILFVCLFVCLLVSYNLSRTIKKNQLSWNKSTIFYNIKAFVFFLECSVNELKKFVCLWGGHCQFQMYIATGT